MTTLGMMPRSLTLTSVDTRDFMSNQCGILCDDATPTAAEYIPTPPMYIRVCSMYVCSLQILCLQLCFNFWGCFAAGWVFHADITRRFFSLPEATKRKIPAKKGGFTRGYIGFGGESGSDLLECKEAFSFG